MTNSHTSTTRRDKCLREDLRALADQLVEAPAGSHREPYLGQAPAVPARSRRRLLAVAAAVVAVAAVGVGVARGGIGSDGSTPLAQSGEGSPTEPAAEDVPGAEEALAAVIDGLGREVEATFAPDAVAIARTNQEDLLAEAREYVAGLDPAGDSSVEGAPSAETDMLTTDGTRPGGLRVAVTVAALLDAGELSWEDDRPLALGAEQVRAPADGVSVWSETQPVLDTGNEATLLEVHTTRGIVSILLEHPEGQAPLSVDAAVAIAQHAYGLG